jgi:acyl-CoA thioesterase-1
VLVGPPAAPRRAEGAGRIDAVLADVAAAADVPYISTFAWDLEYLDDQLHLTEVGHVAFGDAVAAALEP